MSMRRSRIALTSILFASSLVLLNVPAAHAIPAFARKYETSC
jgi:hypothetical protein